MGKTKKQKSRKSNARYHVEKVTEEYLGKPTEMAFEALLGKEIGKTAGKVVTALSSEIGSRVGEAVDEALGTEGPQRYAAGVGYAATPARGDSRGMMREFSAGNMPAQIPVPERTAMGEHPALMPLSRGMGGPLQGPLPTYPIVSSPTITGFIPQAIPIPHVGVRVAPQKNPWEIVYDRYQGTWNGQPNATYPKVGF